MQVSVDDGAAALQDISNDITSVNFGATRNVQDITGLDKAGMERLYLLSDGKVSLTGVFNDAANKSHAVFKTISSQAAGVTRTVTIVVSGDTLSMEMLADGYNLTRGADGSLTWTVNFQLADGTAPTWS